MKANVVYEENIQIDVRKAFDLTLQWLNGQRKAKIKTSSPPTFIEAKQGTMMTSTGHDPNWKKRIRINFYELGGNKTLIRVDATPLARNVFRVEKLKQSWFDGLFSHLFSLLHTYGKQSKPKTTTKPDVEGMTEAKNCPNCGKRIQEKITICPACGVEVV